MAVADPEGNVSFSVGFFDPADPSSDDYQIFTAPSTVTVGALADAVATSQGVATGAVSLMTLPFPKTLPAIDTRATLLSASIMANGARVILVPGS